MTGHASLSPVGLPRPGRPDRPAGSPRARTLRRIGRRRLLTIRLAAVLPASARGAWPAARRLLVVPVALSLALVLAPSAALGDESPDKRPGGSHASALAERGEVIPGEYLVELADADAQDAVDGEVRQLSATVSGGVVLVEATAEEAAELATDPDVVAVEPNTVFTIATSRSQTNAPAGLDRLDQRALPLDSRFRYSASGSGVTIYVVDTGVYGAHSDFTGRVRSGYNVFTGGRGNVDCNGHGTHVAGTAAGERWGVAKSARIVPVKVLDCRGTGSAYDVVAGLDWIRANHRSGRGVVNVSVGGPASSFVEQATNRLIDRGLTVVAAAGNEGAPACWTSPASTPRAITVTASNPANDTEPAWANYGSCVDLYAPGVGIRSAYPSSTTATAVFDGTSMAAPHVAGIAAHYLERNPGASTNAVHRDLVADATAGAIRYPFSANRLAYAQFQAPGTFWDVAGNTHEANILAIAAANITSGYSNGTYRPSGLVTRGQMATFLAKGLDLPPATASFTDVAGHTHADNIARVAAAGIVSGYPDGTFRPDATLTRGHMATYLAKALALPPGDAPFSDIAGHTHEANIRRIAAAGIASGYSDGTYRPNQPVRRDQMATFLFNGLLR